MSTVQTDNTETAPAEEKPKRGRAATAAADAPAADAPTPNTAAAQVQEVRSFGQYLSTLPKRKVRLRKGNGKNENKTVRVVLNGYIYEIAKGEEVEIPEPIFDILLEAGEL